MDVQHTQIRGYARRLTEKRDDLARAQLSALGDVIPGLIDRDMRDLAQAAAAANIESLAALLEHGRESDINVPVAVSALVRRLAWAGADEDMVARAYRIGHESLYEDIRDYCRGVCSDADQALSLLGELGHAVLRFSDQSTTLVIQQFQRERDDLQSNALAKRASVVRSMPEREPADLKNLEKALGYGLAGTHTAVRIWTPESYGAVSLKRLRDVAEGVVAAAGGPTSMAIQDEPEKLMLWVRARLDSKRIERVARRLDAYSEIRVAVGSAGNGVLGFQQTRRQADRAAFVGPELGCQLVVYADVSLVALLLENSEAARAFMEEELGELALRGEANETLRATLFAYLRHQCGVLPTARAMFLHRNTISERIRRVEVVLGRSISERAAELDAALRLHQHFA